MEKMQYEEQLRLLERVEPQMILDRLMKVSQQGGGKLQFFNYYKEVPISAPAELLYVFGDTLACRTSETQSRAIKDCRYTILRSARLENKIYANAVYNEETDEIVLSDFALVDVMPDRRDALRVKISGFFEVEIEAGEDRFKARLTDLSLGGCAISVKDKALFGNFTYFYLNLSLSLENQSPPHDLRVMARLLRFENDTPPYRSILVFEHDRRSEDLIGRFVAQRQGEIIRELKDR